MIYNCKVNDGMSARWRTAPEVTEGTQTNDWFHEGDEFTAIDLLQPYPGREEWLKFTAGDGFIYYVAAIYPRPDGSPKKYISYEAVDQGQARIVKITQVFNYIDNGNALESIDLTEWLSDGSHTIRKFKEVLDADA